MEGSPAPGINEKWGFLGELYPRWPTRLEFEKYAGVAESRLQQICSELCQRDGIFEVLMHHRVGPIESGENVVFVVVLGAHRDEAFKTVQDGINRLKNEVPIFKKEIKIDGSFWVHARP